MPSSFPASASEPQNVERSAWRAEKCASGNTGHSLSRRRSSKFLEKKVEVGLWRIIGRMAKALQHEFNEIHKSFTHHKLWISRQPLNWYSNFNQTPLEPKDRANFFCPSLLEQFHSEATSEFYPPAAYSVHLLLVLVKLILSYLLFIIVISKIYGRLCFYKVVLNSLTFIFSFWHQFHYLK